MQHHMNHEEYKSYLDRNVDSNGGLYGRYLEYFRGRGRAQVLLEKSLAQTLKAVAELGLKNDPPVWAERDTDPHHLPNGEVIQMKRLTYSLRLYREAA